MDSLFWDYGVAPGGEAETLRLCCAFRNSLALASLAVRDWPARAKALFDAVLKDAELLSVLSIDDGFAVLKITIRVIIDPFF